MTYHLARPSLELSLSEYLLVKRRRAGVRQVDAADLFGTNPKMYSRWEKSPYTAGMPSQAEIDINFRSATRFDIVPTGVSPRNSDNRTPDAY